MTVVELKTGILVAIVGCCMATSDVGAQPPANDRTTVHASPEEVSQLLKDLADSSFPVRERATRRLLAIGLDAREALEKIAKEDDGETTLRARAILDNLDQLLFAGVEVSLSFSQPTTTWNRPVDLLVTLSNRSRWTARVPFNVDQFRDRGEKAELGDADQVGMMLDLADWLKVRSPNGGEVDLRVDDIAMDTEVAMAVRSRLADGPAGVLAAGQRISLRVPSFNRGWARYPCLDEGNYTVQFEYTPEWDDPVLKEERIGRVTSDAVMLAVTQSAPATVSRQGGVTSLLVQRDGDALKASLTNTWDRPLMVNANFGFAPPFAQGRWVYTLDENVRDIPISQKTAESWNSFDAASLRTVAPGESLTLATIGVAELRQRFSDAGADVSNDRWTLHFSYTNQLDRRWHTRFGTTLLGNSNAPAVLQTLVPRELLATRDSSPVLIAPTE